jgi:hypothetical protein
LLFRDYEFRTDFFEELRSTPIRLTVCFIFLLTSFDMTVSDLFWNLLMFVFLGLIYALSCWPLDLPLANCGVPYPSLCSDLGFARALFDKFTSLFVGLIADFRDEFIGIVLILLLLLGLIAGVIVADFALILGIYYY